MIDLYNPDAGQLDVDFSGTQNLSVRKAPLVPNTSPTMGVSSAYLDSVKTDPNRKWPQAVYFSFEGHPRGVKNQAELDQALQEGGSLSKLDFEPQMVAVKEDTVGELQKQLAVLQQAVASLSKGEKPPNSVTVGGKSKKTE
jgi:hypothetical protein